MSADVNDIVTLTIEKLVYGGDGLGRVDQLAVFVPWTAPHDIIRAKIVTRKKRYARAELLEIITPSPVRITPPCPYIQHGCGGCPWQHLAYDSQLAIKRELVVEGLRHALPAETVEVHAVVGMTDPFHFRNKVTAKCVLVDHENVHLGFFAANSHRVVSIFSLPTGSCLVQHRQNNQFLADCGRSLPAFASWLNKRPITSIAVRSGMDVLGTHVPRLTTDLPAAIVARLKTTAAMVADRVAIPCRGLTFQVSGQSFFQTNTSQAEILVDTVAGLLLSGKHNGTLVDLFCGVGLFALSFAGFFDRVYGIESSRSALRDAEINSKTLAAEQVTWIGGRAEKMFSPLAARLSTIDAVILDPPREGCDQRLLQQLAASKVARIVYVACDLATLCRDVQRLAALGYQLLSAQPVDMFPHTYHLEIVAFLVRKVS